MLGPESLQEYNDTQVKVDSFREFTSLEYLTIPEACLSERVKFSPRLGQLDIEDSVCSIRDLVMSIAKNVKAGLYLDLKEITVN
ncbi:hypothetical protein N7532_000245 [Penicillium argentinense]|uniref:Uncharacterized protein n=1 Tax=Penicillium argentinense TaxID=1131581 RepID=A0A9W9KN27_9EURO|nr:uncharacterized protein N7532_000245 [Penicillium argentinense]KAJ5112200.1 hypothetical protein N7532_000245 [Penicillium argentinense]